MRYAEATLIRGGKMGPWHRLAVTLACAGTIGAHHLTIHRPTLAAPGVIVFSGGPLRTVVALSDWAENQRLMMAVTTPTAIPETVLARRPTVNLAMFWGGEWSRYASSPESLAILTRTREAQAGAYYPAWHRQPAVWVFGPMGAMPSSQRRVSSDGIAILRAHALPVAIR